MISNFQNEHQHPVGAENLKWAKIRAYLLGAIVLLLVLLFLRSHGWAQEPGLGDTGNQIKHVICDSGCSSSSSPSYGAAFPATGTPVGFKQGTNLSWGTVDGSNNLNVNCTVGCSASAGFADNAAFTAGTTTLNIAAGWYSTTPTNCTSGSACAAQLTLDRKLLVQAFQGTSPWVVSNGGTFAVQAAESGTWNVTVNTALPAGTNVIGHVISDTGSTTAVTGTVNVSEQASTPTTATLQNAAVASGNGTLLSTNGQSAAILTVNCATCSGGTTVNFEGTEDATNFTAISAVQIGTNTLATATAASGITEWEIPVAGFQSVRARISAYSAGTVTVTGHAVPVPFNPKVVNANVVNTPAVTQSGTWNVTVNAALPAGTNVIGHVINDTGSTTAVTGNVTVQQATGTNLHAVLDTTSTTAVTQATGTNLHAVLDTTSTTAVTQATGTNLHAVIDSGSTTAVTGNVTVVQATGTNLHTVCDSGCSSSAGFADNAAFTTGTTAINPVGGLFDDTPPTAIVAGKAAGARITANRALHMNLRNQAGTEIGTAATPVQVSLANTGANTNKLLVTPDSVALPANQSVNVSQINGVTPLMGNGTTGTGSPRVTIASDNTAFAVNAATTQVDTQATGTISATDALGGTPGGAGVLISTAPTANSFVALSIPGGSSQIDVMITGTATGTYWFEGSMDSTTGSDGSWITTNYRQTGIVNTVLGASFTTNGIFRGNGAGFKYVRVRNIGGTTPSNPITIRATNGGGTAFLNASIPAGTNVIGHVINDSGSTTAVTGNVTVAQATGTNLHAVLDTTSTTAVTQATGTNLHAVLDTTSTTAVTQATAANLNATVVGTLANNGVAAATNRIGVAAGVVQTDPANGTAFTQGRDAAPNVGTDGNLWTSIQPALRPASYSASKSFAASSTTDNAVYPGNATNTVLITRVLISCTQTTAGIVTVNMIKRSTADTVGTSAAMTVVPDDSTFAAASSAPLSYTGTGPTVGTAIGNVDTSQIGCNAAATAGPNDIYILDRRLKPIVLRGVAQQLAVNFGAALTGGNITVTFETEEVKTITP